MFFHTPAFLFLFLPAACVFYWTTRSRPALHALALPLTGIASYSFAGFPQLALLLAMTLVTLTAVGRSVGSAGRPHRGLGLGVLLLNLAILGGFKLVQAFPSGAGVALPLGISFYTFNLVSYGLDVAGRRTKPAASIWSLIAYSTFFPTVAAGPLLRFDVFEKQRASPARAFDAELLALGLLNLIVGLAKKVLIADPLGIAVEPLFASYERLGMWDAWLAVSGYAYQLYFDFSGYTDMAIGAAAPARLPGAHELQCALHGSSHHRLLAALAHQHVPLVPGLPVLAAQPQPAAAQPVARKRRPRAGFVSDPHDAGDRLLARQHHGRSSRGVSTMGSCSPGTHLRTRLRTLDSRVGRPRP